MTTCASCATPTQDGRTLCDTCARSVIEDLRALAGYLPFLHERLDPAVVPGGRTGGTAGAKANAPAAINIKVFDRIDVLDSTLRGYARALYGDRSYGRLPLSSLPAVIIASGRIAQNPTSGVYKREIHAQLAKVRALVEPPDAPMAIGHCETCGAQLRAVRGETRTQCPSCGSTWDVEQVKRRLAESLDGKREAMTPNQAARWLTRMTGVPVERGLVSVWLSRGRLPSARRLENGKWVFDLGELMKRIHRPG